MPGWIGNGTQNFFTQDNIDYHILAVLNHFLLFYLCIIYIYIYIYIYLFICLFATRSLYIYFYLIYHRYQMDQRSKDTSQHHCGLHRSMCLTSSFYLLFTYLSSPFSTTISSPLSPSLCRFGMNVRTQIHTLLT